MVSRRQEHGKASSTIRAYLETTARWRYHGNSGTRLECGEELQCLNQSASAGAFRRLNKPLLLASVKQTQRLVSRHVDFNVRQDQIFKIICRKIYDWIKSNQ